MDDALWFQGDDGTAGTDSFGHEHRVTADVGTDIDGDHARLQDLAEEMDLALRELAVKVE